MSSGGPPGDGDDDGVHGPGNSDCDTTAITAHHMLRYRARDTTLLLGLVEVRQNLR